MNGSVGKKMKQIEKNHLTNDELLQKAVKLSAIVNQIQLIERLIENVNYSRVKKDDFAVHYQIKTGLLDDINESLRNLSEDIQNISDDLCPGEY